MQRDSSRESSSLGCNETRRGPATKVKNRMFWGEPEVDDLGFQETMFWGERNFDDLGFQETMFWGERNFDDLGFRLALAGRVVRLLFDHDQVRDEVRSRLRRDDSGGLHHRETFSREPEGSSFSVASLLSD